MSSAAAATCGIAAAVVGSAASARNTAAMASTREDTTRGVSEYRKFVSDPKAWTRV